MTTLPTPPWLVALDHIGSGHGHTALRCLEVLRGEDKDVTGALRELTEVALGADQELLPHISTVVGALEELAGAEACDQALTGRLADLFDRIDPVPAEVDQDVQDVLPLHKALNELPRIYRTILTQPGHPDYRHRCAYAAGKLSGLHLHADLDPARRVVLAALEQGAKGGEGR